MFVPKSSLSSALVDRHQCVSMSSELPNVPIFFFNLSLNMKSIHLKILAKMKKVTAHIHFIPVSLLQVGFPGNQILRRIKCGKCIRECRLNICGREGKGRDRQKGKL